MFEKPLWKSFRKREDWTLTALDVITKSKRKLKRHYWLVIRIFLISVFFCFCFLNFILFLDFT